MSSFKQPLYKSDIFSSGLFDLGSDTLTLDQADERYLKLSGGIVRGSTTFNAGLSVNGSLTLNGSAIDLSLILGITNGTALASKALIVDSNRSITNIGSLSATADITTTASFRVSRATNGQSFNSTNGTSICVLYQFLNGDAYFGTTSANNLVFQTGNNARMTINGTTGAITGIGSLTATTLTGQIQTANQPLITSIGTLTSLTVSGSVVIGATTLSEANLTKIDSITNGIASASKALVLDSSLNITGINSLSCASLTVNGSAVATATDLTYLTGVVPGVASSSKALVCNAGRNISNLNFVTTEFIKINQIMQWQGDADWNFRQPVGSYMQIDCGTTTALAGLHLRLQTGNNTSYNDWSLRSINTSSGASIGFYTRNTNTSAQGRNWIHSTEGFGLCARASGFVASSAQADLFLTTAGVVKIGSSGNAISSNHKLEVGGALMVSNTASTTVLPDNPIIGIFDSSQSIDSAHGWLYMGRGLDNFSSWYFSSFYTGSSGANNYLRLSSVSSTTTTGLIISGNNNVAINGFSSGTTVIKPICPLSVNGYVNVAVPAGWKLGPSGTASVGGGTVGVSISCSNDIWCSGTVYSSSDERFKTNIEDITDEDALKMLKVKPVSYQWKKSHNDNREVGVIAQQLMEIGLGEAFVKITKSSDADIDPDCQLTVSYDRLVCHLIKLVQIQAMSIASNQKQLDDLKLQLGKLSK